MHKFEGECDERLCGKNIYIGCRTNESLVSFISFNRFFGKQGGRPKTTFANWNEFEKKKKKYDKLFLLLHSRERYNNVIQRNYITFSR